MLLKIINNRNFILISSLILGLTFNQGANFLKPVVLPVLALVMVFSSTSFEFRTLKKYNFFIKSTVIAFLLNFVVFGAIVLGLAAILFDDNNLWIGFVVIAATPPGVAIIPFTLIYKGNVNYAMLGVIGTYILAIIVSPLIIEIFVPDSGVSAWQIIKIMLQVILLPIIISRLLLIKKFYPTVTKIRGKVVNWGFAIIIYSVVGLNKNAIFGDPDIVLKIVAVFTAALFIMGILHNFLSINRVKRTDRIVSNLFLTIKSSGFAAGTALSLFGKEAALPAAIMAVFVVAYLLFTAVLFKP